MTREEEYEALRMVNVRNAAFWAGVEARDRQLESMPPPQRLFFGDEEYWTRHVRSEQARKAGASEKGDPLTIAIRRIVEDDPNISEGELRKRLWSSGEIELLDDKDHGVIGLSFATQIRFELASGKLRDIPISALKDRLSRAKSFRANRMAQAN